MAQLNREFNCIDLRVALIGLPPAIDTTWNALLKLATATQGDASLYIPQRGHNPELFPGYAHRMQIMRCPMLDREFPLLHLAAHLAATRPLSDSATTTLVDALFLVLDCSKEHTSRSLTLFNLISDALPLFANGVADAPIPRVLIAGGAPLPPTGAKHQHHWRHQADALLLSPPALNERTLKDALRHLSERCEAAWHVDPPRITEPIPRLDLHGDDADLGERLARANANAPPPATRTQNLLQLANLYRRAGHLANANAFLAEAALNPTDALWQHLDEAPLDPLSATCLRSWPLPPGPVRGLASLDGGQAFAVLQEEHLLWAGRQHDQLQRLRCPRPLSATIASLAGQEILLLDRALHAYDLARNQVRSAPTPLPRHWLDANPELNRCDVSPHNDAILLVGNRGLCLASISRLDTRHCLDRDDLLDAFLSGDDVLTIHRQGGVGHWRANTDLIERVYDFGAPIRAAAFDPLTGTLAALCLWGGQVNLHLVDAQRWRRRTTLPTVLAERVWLPPGAQRVLTTERRLLRLRNLAPSHAPPDDDAPPPPALTLFDPPPWLAQAVLVQPRTFIVHAATHTGRLPARINLWA